MKRLPLVLILLSVLTGPLQGCESKQEEMGPDVLIMVNGASIKTQDLQRTWAALPNADKKDYAGPEGLKKLIDELVVWKLLAQKARNQGIDQNADLKDRVNSFEENLLVNALLEEGITDEDIFRYYNSHYIHGFFIWVRTTENDGAQKKAALAKAEELYKELSEGAKFEELLNREIDKGGDVGGGDMGYVTHEEVTDRAGFAAAEALFGLAQPGDLSRPIEGKGGVFVFYLVEPKGQLNPAGLNPDIAGWYRETKRQEIIRSYHNELQTNPDIKIEQNEKAFRDLIQTLEPAWENMEKARTGAADGSTAEPAPQPEPQPETGTTSE